MRWKLTCLILVFFASSAFAEFQNYYEVLGISPSSGLAEIKRAYRQKAVEYHPDKHQGDPVYADKFRAATDAYRVLSDPQMKKRYDQFLSTPESREINFEIADDQEHFWFSAREHTEADYGKFFRDYFSVNERAEFQAKSSEEAFVYGLSRYRYNIDSLKAGDWAKILVVLKQDKVDSRLYDAVNETLYWLGSRNPEPWPADFWLFIDQNLPLLRLGQCLYGLNSSIQLQKKWPIYFSSHLEKILDPSNLVPKGSEVGVRNLKIAVVENLLSRKNHPLVIANAIQEFLQGDPKSELYNRAMDMAYQYVDRPEWLDETIALNPQHYKAASVLLQKESAPKHFWSNLFHYLYGAEGDFNFYEILLYANQFSTPMNISELFWEELAKALKKDSRAIEAIFRTYKNITQSLKNHRIVRPPGEIFDRIGCDSEDCFKSIVTILEKSIQIDQESIGRVSTWSEIRETYEAFEAGIALKTLKISSNHPKYLVDKEIRSRLASSVKNGNESYRWNKHPPTQVYQQIHSAIETHMAKKMPLPSVAESSSGVSCKGILRQAVKKP